MLRIQCLLVALVGALLIAPQTVAQERGSKVESPKVLLRIAGLRKSTADELQQRLESFKDRAEFEVDARRQRISFQLKAEKKLTLGELTNKIEEGKKFKVGEPLLIGRCNVAWTEEALNKLGTNWKALRSTLSRLRSTKNVTNVRPGEGRSADITVKAPGVPLSTFSDPIRQAVGAKKDDPSVVSEVTWLAPSTGEEEQETGHGGRKGKKGSKKGDGDKEPEKKEDGDKEKEKEPEELK